MWRDRSGHEITYRNRRVKYYPFPASAGSSLVLITDPFGYLRARLASWHAKRRGERRQRCEVALYFAELAEEYAKASRVLPTPARALTTYYCLLNLMKSFLSLKGPRFAETKEERHGLRLVTDKEVEVFPTRGRVYNVFSEFVSALTKHKPTKAQYGFLEAAYRLPEIHEIGVTLSAFPASRRLFVPVEIGFMTNDREDRAWVEVSFANKHLERIDDLESRFMSGYRNRYFRKCARQDDTRTRFESKETASWTSSKPTFYRPFQEHLRKAGVASLLTRDDYRYYMVLDDGPMCQLCYGVMLLFYIGMVVRYRPKQARLLFSSEYTPVIAEALSLTPPQFTYHIVSHMTDSVCVTPHAQIAH